MTVAGSGGDEMEQQDSRPGDVSNIPKLEDAKFAGKDSQKCTLILTEGDSAKSLVMMGLTVVNNREHYGVFPLRGKLPNATRASMKKVLKNNVINNLTRILGLVCDENVLGKKNGVDIRKSLRYGRILLMMDQDHDGSHIKGLVINLIHRMWPTLVRTTNCQFIYQFTTPIVKATHSKSDMVKSFYTIQAFEDWRKDENDVSSWTTKYYKGLGNSTDQEAIDYFKEMDKSINIFTWKDELDSKAIEVAFDKTKVKDRKDWILSFQSNNYLDRDEKYIRFKDFIDKEYILYAKAKLRRNIPSIMDGLVPAQRKILYCSFKKNLVKEIKVNQFVGCVSWECAYHHDEECLAQTVIKMAQNFVGKNNINLLKPIGQYGSCNLAGKDHASHRYLNTELSPVTRYLFCNDDDKILNYNMDENGKTIEPKWFLPVIPMVLVNGSQGIGIGWNSFVPKYNPKDIINNIKRKFNGESLEEDKMTPWYKGFKGTIVRKDKGIYHIDGLVTHGKGYTYHIKELPIGTSIEGYKKYLKSISKGTAKNNTPLIKEFEQIGDSRTVGFHIEFIQAPSKDDDLIEILNLRTTISTNDMHLYNKRNHIEKFNSAEKILEHFYYERLEKYKKRWDVMLQNIESDLIDMENTKKFVMLARSRKFGFLTEDSKDLRKICMDHNIAADSIQSLLSLPLSAFSNEGLKKVEDKIQEKEEEKNALFNKTEIQLWKDDLDTFEEEWQKEEASWKSDTMSQACPICEPPINSNADMGQELLGRGKRTIKKPGHLNAFYLE
ncbi:DNA topoisomerase 2-like [Trifolium pratense]|nr:DNA topoisomerase 2-like [Trifolium pratense]